VSDDPFSAYNHPLQPWALAAHVLVVPLLVLALGWTWGVHASPRVTDRERSARASGLANVGLGLLMIFSGYALQVVSTEGARLALAWTHGVSGSLFALLLTTHAVAGRRSRRIDGEHTARAGHRGGIPPQARPVNRMATKTSRKDAARRPEEVSGSP
ncbi:MAG: hypothetical protein D6685_14120, partial [Bacteroidetes bacterium]